MGLFNKTNKNEIIVVSPVDGKIKPLAKVNDEVFASELVGKGIAVTPISTEVLSPLEGKIKVAFPTGHAYGIGTKQGPELLVHIGVDTVNLNGKGFVKHVDKDLSVKAGTKLADIDLTIIKKEAKSTDIIVVITNETFGNFEITETASGDVKAGDMLYKLERR